MKDAWKYLGWMLLIGVVLWGGLTFQHHLRLEASRNFEIWPLFLYSTLFPIFLGVLLRLPRFIKERKGRKEWKVNWIKLLIVGIPLCYVTFVPLLAHFIPLQFLPFTLEIMHIESWAITGIILGYVVLGSFVEK
ncbi:hypothetical protein BpOF4_17020 [Alkalihalophilus pseudofirmus OF4]|uniref:Uncharacterized protein n=1 Tax=Alkalihalophilus pseudofirmus (strain ATCC BAA-2126 / JCM 17055 / OF4) TaxID=398511 RepID=D3FQS7_ALKPO|nr:hypothetical protein [Alkalihalophilus pseudofirmus]ADC51447.1 hypothetical protein BpOF4_17020 [Alkalihalophilus pseudofirmus OF4]